MGKLIPTTRTKPGRDAWLDAMAKAWVQVDGRVPNAMALGILFAQFAFETGYGDSCWCWNLGNVRLGGWKGDYFELKKAWELEDGVEVVRGGYFRAHGSLESGALEHLTFLSSMPRYQRAFDVLRFACDGPVVLSRVPVLGSEFVHALKIGGYFTGDLRVYTNAVVDIAARVVRDFEIAHSETSPDSPVAKRRTLEEVPEEWGALDASQFLERTFYEEWSTPAFLASRWDADASIHATIG